MPPPSQRNVLAFPSNFGPRLRMDANSRRLKKCKPNKQWCLLWKPFMFSQNQNLLVKHECWL